MIKECPVCGTPDAEVSQTKSLTTRKLFDGSEITFESDLYTCSICGEDFFEANVDKVFEEARELRLQTNAMELLSSIKKEHKSISYIERIFGIPQRTISRWKFGQVTSVAYAFLFLIGRLPWLAEIVEAKFDKATVAKVLAREAEIAVKDVALYSGIEMTKSVTMSSPSKGEIKYNFETCMASPATSVLSQDELVYFTAPKELKQA